MEAIKPQSLRVTIEAEADRKCIGQWSAYRLAHMLARRGHEVSVRLVGRHAERRKPVLKPVA
jgi:hypothetical protein